MKAALDGNNITITLPINPTVSKTGKSKVIATTNGFAVSDVLFEGKVVKVSANIIIPIK